jgi:glycosyltransferase involved in cell wall biosynthesis
MPTNKQEEEEYGKNQYSQFGAWRFDEAALDWKVDVVCAIRDFWMDQMVFTSPLRPYYSVVAMPTTDSASQLEEWVSAYSDIDICLTYTDFSKRVLEEESGGLVKVFASGGFGVNFDDFHPIHNKDEHRRKYGLPPDSLICGTVMRNQPRKLFSELIEAFAAFLKKYPAIGEKTYLYLHTSYPDLGWDLPRLIKNSGISHKILLTYLCTTCGNIFVSHFQDAKTACVHCGNPTAVLPNVYKGVTTAQLCEIYNLLDVYIQYAVAEGLGLGIIEAGACGIPVIAVNYSGMESVLEKLGGTPIDIQQMYRECASHCLRVYPSKDDFVEKLHQLLSLPDSVRKKHGFDTHAACRKHFDWDTIAAKWMSAIDNCPPPKLSWDSPPNIRQPNPNIPRGMDNQTFVRWCIINILCDPSKLNSFLEARLVKNLNYQTTLDGAGGLQTSELGDPTQTIRPKPFSHKDVVDQLVAYRQRQNDLEYKRVNWDKIEKPLFVRMANASNS